MCLPNLGKSSVICDGGSGLHMWNLEAAEVCVPGEKVGIWDILKWTEGSLQRLLRGQLASYTCWLLQVSQVLQSHYSTWNGKNFLGSALTQEDLLTFIYPLNEFLIQQIKILPVPYTAWSFLLSQWTPLPQVFTALRGQCSLQVSILLSRPLLEGI